MDTLKGLPTKKLGGFTEADSEIQFLENLFNEDCKCQSNHESSVCSHEVTHILKYTQCSHPSKRICDSAVMQFNAEKGLYRCAWCGDIGKYYTLETCWIITPI